MLVRAFTIEMGRLVDANGHSAVKSAKKNTVPSACVINQIATQDSRINDDVIPGSPSNVSPSRSDEKSETSNENTKVDRTTADMIEFVSGDHMREDNIAQYLFSVSSV